MKTIILGAGEVGATLAENLAEENHDVTIVDTNEVLLRPLQDRLDVRAVTGYASHPAILRQAGADDADLIIAVTQSDEVNMVACQIAYTLFHTPTKVARIRSSEYLAEPQLFHQEAIPIDMTISPEQLVTDYIKRLIQFPGALQVVDFAQDNIQVAGVQAYYGGALVGEPLSQLKKRLPNVNLRVTAIYRRDRPIELTDDTIIETDDEIYFVAARANVRRVISELRHADRRIKHVMLAGGGHIGERLAKALERTCQVKVIESSARRARKLSYNLDNAITLQGDAANESLLREENIDHVDVFCAITNDDEANILSAMLAKRLGARKVMSLINRLAYVDLVQSSGNQIDIAISPKQSTISALLAHVRRGDVVRVHALRRGAAEVMELVVHGEQDSSRVVDRRIGDIQLPKGATFGGVIRGRSKLLTADDTVLGAGDHVIVFIADKQATPGVERLFQVGARHV
ncbi:Trk system potassium transporter TrkA [Salinisphaera sp. USBA-960]|uniref:Trk system potassium transporter TrkA n=1 Tax=Salinisphaera orenii TaxID=856731 RepID=UPI000DBE026E|nr:Trk system potassium transporter TrkA [Salifodinibacter halophilus]NNC25490.1 Trk system potassium transporter TrkA [Salifodinibacter halophilus]